MKKFRTVGPVVVEARQCAYAETIATDTGFVNVASGEWVVCGKNGECYVMEDGVFRRVFRAMEEEKKQARGCDTHRVLAFRASLRRRLQLRRIVHVA